MRGMQIAVERGLRGLHLAELTKCVGISKPFFYTFFDSLEDFSLQLMEEQRSRLCRLLEQELSRPEGTGRTMWRRFSGWPSVTGTTGSW